MPYSGWVGNVLAECAGMTDLVTTSRSPWLLTGRQRETRVVLSEVATVSTPSAALADLRLLREHPECLRELAESEPQEGLTQGPIKVTRLREERPLSAMYLVRASCDYKGLVTDTEYTVELIARGSREVLLVTIADNGSFDRRVRATLLGTLLSRVGAAPA
jgi:hypothetical protein